VKRQTFGYFRRLTGMVTLIVVEVMPSSSLSSREVLGREMNLFCGSQESDFEDEDCIGQRVNSGRNRVQMSQNTVDRENMS